MTTSLPAPLVRLREADIVRLCGLSATAHGLELASRHALHTLRRDGARLECTLAEQPESVLWVEVPAESAPGMLRWHCPTDAPAGAAQSLGCLHVAALLAAWIRHPEDFSATGVEATEPREQPRAPEAALAPRVRQPMLVAAPSPPEAEGTGLEHDLALLPAVELEALARRVLGPDVEPPFLVQTRDALTDPDRLRALLARLDPGAVTLLCQIVLLGGSLTSADLDGLAYRLERASSALAAMLAVLERHGLVFRVSGGGRGVRVREQGWRQVTGWRVPPEIRAVLDLPLPLAELPAQRGGAVPLLPGASSALLRLRPLPGSPRPLLGALAVLARAPAPLGPPPLDQDVWSAAARLHGRTVPRVPGDLAPERLVELARGAGLPPGLLQHARRLLIRVPDAETVLDPVGREPGAWARTLRQVFQSWARRPALDELADLELPGSPIRARYDTAHPAYQPEALADEARAARHFALRVLRRLHPGAWHGLDDLVRLAWQVHPHFLRGRQHLHTAPVWWLERAEGGPALRMDVREEWLLGEGAYLRAFCAGAAAWWGLVDQAYDAEGQVVALRQTQWGAYLLGRGIDPPPEVVAELAREPWGPAVLPTRGGALAVQPIAAGAPLLALLERWARPTTVAGGRLVYTLSAELAAQAFDASVDSAPLVAALGRLEGGARVAQLVADRIAGWQARYGRAEVTSGWTLLEGRDAATLREALHLAPEIAARARHLSETAVLLSPADAAALHEVLTRRGYHL